MTATAGPSPTDQRPPDRATRHTAPPEGGDWLSAEEQHVWRRLLAVHARLLERLDDDLRSAHGVGLVEYDVLVALAEGPPGGLRMRELAGRVMLSPSGLTRRVDRLVERGLVTRKLCPQDGRGALAAMTPAGSALLEASAPTHVASVRRLVLGPLGPSGLSRLGAALEEIAAALLDADGPGGRR